MCDNNNILVCLFHCSAVDITYFSLFSLIKGESLHSPIYGKKPSDASPRLELTSDNFPTAQCGLFNSLIGHIEDCPNNLISFYFSNSQVNSDHKKSEDGLTQCFCGSYRLPKLKSSKDTQDYSHGE